jgi:hypothetical protein
MMIVDNATKIRSDALYKLAFKNIHYALARPLTYKIMRSGMGESALMICFQGAIKHHSGDRYPDSGWLILPYMALIRGSTTVKVFLTTTKEFSVTTHLPWRDLAKRLGVDASEVALAWHQDTDQIKALDDLVQTILDKYVELNVPDPEVPTMEPDMEA